jgi:hypothetical protein
MDLRFKHLLTCVKFAIGENMATDCVIKSITLYNVAGQGTVRLDETNGWQIGLQNRDFEMNNIDFPVTSSTTKNTQIAPQVDNGLLATTMLMIPQHFTTDDSKIKMVYKDDAGFHSVEATLNGQNWEPGTTVTYLISTKASSETYTLITTPVTVSHDGGTASFNVTSYKTTTSGTQAMPWRIVGYSLDEGQTWYAEKPVSFNWVGVATTSGTGGTEPQQGALVIAPQEVTGSSESSMDQTADNYSVKLQSDQLNANPTRGGTTDYYDLSTHDLYGNETLRNTANCYVVNAAGYYKLPLVYGNTIKNGVKNDDIFKTDVTRYVHDATIISTPYLKDVDTPDAATLLWQDSNGLVSDAANDTFISEENGEYYLNFHVPSGNTLKPGNAIIGVKKGSDFMWSWHIWVTPIDITSTIEVTNAKGYKYKFMPVNLGWCALNGTFETYSGRSILIKIQQGSGISSIFRITQIGGAELVNSTRGYAPYYQFGRKDPMLPNDGTTYTKDHNQYPTGGSYLWKIQDNATTLTNTIRNPYIMFHPTVNTKSDWCTSTPPWARLWNTTGEEGAWDIKVTKTIYDPCPVGFHVPPSNAFTGFSKTGENTTNKNQIYASNPTTYLTDRGCWFYTNTTLQHQTIFFPASSYRYYLSGKMYEDVHSYYRTAMRSSADETRSICLGLNDDGVNVCFAYTSAAAFYVRPIAE